MAKGAWPPGSSDGTSRRSRGAKVRGVALVMAGALVAGLSVGIPSAAAAEAPECQPATPGGPLFVTEECTDPALNKPYTDVDEQRKVTDPVTNVEVNYRYIHGGFTGTNATFSLYFPDAAEYEGRFFQSTYPTVGHESADPAALAFSLTHGAYVVQSNNGGGVPFSNGLGGYRINAAAAKYSRVIAAEVYAGSERPRGYIYGQSGGAYQTAGSVENTERVWDGSVPVVLGTPNGIPNFATVELLALRVLHDKLPQIVDAMEPGGSGAPYAGLNDEEARILREATRLGFPLRGWWEHASLDGASIAQTGDTVRFIDGGYLEDFWTKPGYAGTDPNESAADARVQENTAVVGLVGTPTSKLVLSNVPDKYLVGAELVITSGAANGSTLPIGTVDGNTVGFGPGASQATIDMIKPGDTLRIDNSWYTALQYYHRYQVPSADMYGWDQFRNAGGQPIYPQRPFLVGPIFANFAGGAVNTGNFNGKMIMLSSLLDVEAFPWSADWYRTKARGHHGAALDDNLRLWFMDNSGHTAPKNTAAESHVVSFDGHVQQALLDLDEWVVSGIEPSASTEYKVAADNQIEVPATASQRRGIQPLVTLSVNGSSERANVAAGQTVTLSVDGRVPPGTGKIVNVEWDVEGTGDYPAATPTNKPILNGLTMKHTFTKPGTYFATVRVTSQRDGDTNTPFTRVQNLDRVRVVVAG
jgi:PKD domain